ncbi:hypothetical protein LPJ79_001725 [Coemansia sp. RSA 1821]|nr:hypothetical protein LPJ79_001725 [Coemansia sp. RSA 1821]
MAEYVQVLERLRSLAIEWTEQYEEIVARSQHIEYLYSNLDKLPSANSLLVYQQHKQIQAQLCKIRQLTRSLAAIVKSMGRLKPQARMQVRGVQKVAGITREYAQGTVDRVYQECRKATRISLGGREAIRELISNRMSLDLTDLQDRLRSFSQMQRFLDVKSQTPF